MMLKNVMIKIQVKVNKEGMHKNISIQKNMQVAKNKFKIEVNL